MFYKLIFFQKSEGGICSLDFKQKQKICTINLSLVLSLSDLLAFHEFRSGFISEYALLTMMNNDKYYLKKDSFIDLSGILNKTIKNKNNHGI